MANYDLIIIGTGTAARKVAAKCRQAGWRVAVVDRRPYGGTCMLRGCDPKKLLWGVAEAVDQARRFANDGFAAKDIAVSWPNLIQFKRSFLQGAPEVVEQQFQSSGIETLHGRAHFVDSNKLAVNGQTIEARHFVIASGSTPAHLPIPGVEYLMTSDDFMEVDQLPDSLVFVGGGYISFEFAHVAARAGAKVTIIHKDDRPLAHFERDLVDKLIEKTRHIGIDLRLGNPVESIEKNGNGVRVSAKIDGTNHPVEAAAVVHGAGRVPDIDDLDLAAGGIDRDGRRLRLNGGLQSVSNPAVYAAGDAAAVGPMLTPVSELDADIVAENLLEGGPHHTPDYKSVPSVVFTIPALASVGLSEDEAHTRNIRFHVAKGDFNSWYSARRVKEDTAAYKFLIEENTNRLIGAHVIGPNADELINLFALAIRLDLPVDNVRQLIPAYPSQAANIEYMLA